MKKALIYIVINSISLYLISLIMKDFYLNSINEIVILSITIGLVNLTLGKLFKILTLPINFLTFGLFSFILNGFLIKYSFTLVGNSGANNLSQAIIISILLTIINRFIRKILY